MPFITQGKSNWKFLLIVVVLAAIVGGGIFWFLQQQIPSYQIIELEIPKKKSNEECQKYTEADCPEGCIVCPPCEACSSLGCYSAEYCKSMGFDKSWYEMVKLQRETADWQTYAGGDVTFKIPSSWIEEPVLIRGSGYTQEFKDSENKFSLTFWTTGNYNQVTGKPYTDIDEYIGMPYEVKTVIVDEQEGRQPLPRAGSENINSVVFFSKDSKSIYTLKLKTGDNVFDTSISDINEGQKLFEQILSTFRFIEKIQTGTIEGSLGYPSEGIPHDMTVCAENIVTKKQYCTDIHIEDSKYRYGEGYKINLPPGDYYVFASLPNWGEYRAYYSEFVTCGMKVSCTSHNPIKVTVIAGETIQDIHPWDWYKTP